MNIIFFNSEAGDYLLLLFLLNFSVYLVFVFLILRYFKVTPKENATLRRKISVIISAKNEEYNISGVLHSLHKQSYPKDLFEIILVDDNSTDDTFLQAKAAEIANLRVLKAENKRYPGKKGALDIAIKHAKYDHIAVTDADCLVSADWLKNINGMFDQGYDIITGAVLFSNPESLIGKYASFEHYRNLLMVHSFANMGMPYSASGGNFAFTREIFEKSGGYGDTLQTLSGDDDLMVQNAIRNNARIGAMLGAGTYTFTDPPESLREHFNRKRRHVSTSLHYSFKNQIILSLWYLSSMVVNTSLLFWVHPFIFLLPLFRYMLEIVLYKRLEKSLLIDKTFGFKLSPLAIILNSLLFDLFTVYTFVSQFFVKTKWKGN